MKIFDFTTSSGNLFKTLEAPNQVAISQSLATQFFGNTNPVGQSINLDDKVDVTITSVFEDTPSNSSLQSPLYVSYESFSSEILGFPTDQWGLSVGGIAFVLLPKNENIETYSKQLPAFVEKYMGDDESMKTELLFQPFDKVHFEPAYASPLTSQAIQPSYLWIFGSIGLFILTIAIFNFVNLSTVQAIKRSKEVGVRKVLGAEKMQLIGQVLGEALTLSAIAGVFAMILSQLSLPYLNDLLGKEIQETLLQSPAVFLFLGSIILLVGLLSGIYPALSFANFKPVTVLKSRTTAGNKNTLWVRRSLVITPLINGYSKIVGTSWTSFSRTSIYP